MNVLFWGESVLFAATLCPLSAPNRRLISLQGENAELNATCYTEISSITLVIDRPKEVLLILWEELDILCVMVTFVSLV